MSLDFKYDSPINDIQIAVHELAVDKGWWEQGYDRNFGEQIALMHSELSEALESWRDDKPFVWFDGHKPEGAGIELADCVIRIFDTLYAKGYDVGTLIEIKHSYNSNRPYRHGGKKA